MAWDPEIVYPQLHNSILRNKVVLKGPFVAPIRTKAHGSLDRLLSLKYDLFAHVVPVVSNPVPEHLRGRFPNIDVVIVRQNTEGEYSGLEHEIQPGIVESLKVVTEKESMRLADYAFSYAKRTGRKTVYAVHKANIMKKGDGLFLSCCQKIAEQFPDITYKEIIVDNTAMQMVKNPAQFNGSVILTTNLYGAIVTNIATGLVEGEGAVGSFTTGIEGVRIYEQGSRILGRDLAGKNQVNPLGLIKASFYMLKYLGLHSHAAQIHKAVTASLKAGEHLTVDMGGNSTTVQFVKDIITRLEEPDPNTKPPVVF